MAAGTADRNVTLRDMKQSPGDVWVPCIIKAFVSCTFNRVQLCESRGGRPGLPVLMSLTVSVDVKQH